MLVFSPLSFFAPVIMPLIGFKLQFEPNKCEMFQTGVSVISRVEVGEFLQMGRCFPKSQVVLPHLKARGSKLFFQETLEF